MNSLLQAAIFRPVYFLAVLGLGGSLAFLFYVAVSVTGLKDNLPLEILQRERALGMVLEDMFELHRAVEHAVDGSHQSDLNAIRGKIADARMHLRSAVERAGRDAARRGGLERAGDSSPAEIRGLVNPILVDLDIWAAEGVDGMPPNSPAVLRAMLLRIEDAPALIGGLLAQAHQEASVILNHEVDRLEGFRQTLLPIMVQIILVGALFAAYALRAQRYAAASRIAEQRLHDAVESIPLGFALFDPESRLVMCNERHRELHPGNREDLVEGAKFLDLLTSAAFSGKVVDAVDDPQGWIKQRFAAFHSPTGSMEVALVDGRHHERIERRTADGGTVMITSDITATRAREVDLLRIGGELRQKNLLLDVAMENMVVGLAMYDAEKRLIMCNRRYLNIYNLPSELGRQGTHMREVMLASARVENMSESETRRSVEARLRMAESCEQIENVEHLADGRVIKRLHRPLLDGGSVTVYEDITARATADRELRAAKEEAETASRSKSEFLANVSHELRTPLNAIIGFSEIIKAELFGPVTPPQYGIYAADIHDSGHHLLSLINDILDLSKIEAGKYEMMPESLDIIETVKASLRVVRERANQGKVRLIDAMPAELPVLSADARALKQILLNLLSNAIKFTMPGGTVTIGAGLRADGGFDVTVTDTGIGMSPEEVEIALSQFGQVDAAFSRRFEGTGLGLPLTLRLVELHGGSLDVQSEKAVGTCATVGFPAERVGRASRSGTGSRAV